MGSKQSGTMDVDPEVRLYWQKTLMATDDT
jgi:hypothetical protein